MTRAAMPSPRDLDPLSWFTGANLPGAAAILLGLYGAVLIAVQWTASREPALQVLALLLGLGACVVIHIVTRPMQRGVGWGVATLAFAAATAGMVLSAADYDPSRLALSLWWGPGLITLVAAALSPYLSARRIIVLGSAATVVGAGLSTAILAPENPAWGPVGSAVIIATAPLFGIIATSTFSAAIVRQMIPLLENPSRLTVAGRALHDAAADQVEQVTLARLTARAAPFLEGLAERGSISQEERALAGQLARRIRDDLVTQANISWLDSIADRSRLVVVDPDRLARRMNHAQRTALRGLLHAVLDLPGTDAGSLLVELRAAPDGATAVGVSLDAVLPEGRRITHLAPYLLTLGTAVEDLRIDRARRGVSFRVPGPEASGRGPAVRRAAGR